MSSFLDLPTELACEIVSQWLFLKDVVRLDSAFCHNVTRIVLHESVFQSPICTVMIANPPFSMMAPVIFSWVSMKCIRLSSLHVTSGVKVDKCEDYLKRVNGSLRSVAFRFCRGDSTMLLTLVVRYCTNLRVLVAFYCDLSPCVDILTSCLLLRSIDIESNISSTHLVTSIPATHHLQIASITLRCSSRDEEVILGMCDPQCVQRLRLSNMTHATWNTYTNLRSFGLRYNHREHDANLLSQICTLCTSIVNLSVSGFALLMDEMVVPAIRALKQLRAFNCENQVYLTDRVLHTLIEHHKHTLEAVYLYGCDSVSTSAKSRLLKECVKLHTISCTVWNDIDYSLMGNLTTLIMNFPSYKVWKKVQHHCHSLQCLHLVPPLHGTAVDSYIIVTPGKLQALRTVYTAKTYVHDLRLQLPSVCVVEEAHSKWYDLFELPI